MKSSNPRKSRLTRKQWEAREDARDIRLARQAMRRMKKQGGIFMFDARQIIDA